MTLKHGGKSYPVETEMVAPGTTGRFLLKGVDAVSAKGAAQVNFSAINDYGVPIKHVISITR
ncbi:hypothetical protein [Pseudomonas paralactis]|uniref:fimbrial biogenesis chaperone n=1 Tax=Pseudomonas paralactis TaxID=1615673 RepID=UPI0034D6277A